MMCKKWINRMMVVLVLGLILSPAHADLVGHWAMDEMSGAVAYDSSPSGWDGIVSGGAEGNWIPDGGKLGGTLDFTGQDYVIVSDFEPTEGIITVGVWGYARSRPGWSNLVTNWAGETGQLHFGQNPSGQLALFYTQSGGETVNIADGEAFPLEEWQHCAFVADSTNLILYRNGSELARAAYDGTAKRTLPLLGIGCKANGNSNSPAPDGGVPGYWDGFIDDVTLFDHALNQDEINALMEGVGAKELASGPAPEDAAVDVLRDTMLNWEPGPFAVTHDLYLGTAFDDVNDADRANSAGVLVSQAQDADTYDPGRLEFSQTYFWRVDEVNSPPDSTVFKGEVWSFTVESFSIPIGNVTATASSSFGTSGPERTIDGSGLVDGGHGVNAADMWISEGIPATIDYAFDRAYKLHELWIWNSNQLIEAFVGFGAKDVVIEHSLDGENWIVLEGVGPLAQAPGTGGYAHNNTIDFGGITAQHIRMTLNTAQGIAPQVSLSEVRFFFIPTYATGPNPATDATNVAPDTTLSWGRNGREADRHEVYVGTNANDLALEGAVSESSFSTDALDLQLGTRYTWRVDEVNEAMDPSVWTGDLWSFTTADTITVDDMESYRDEEFLEIWATWIDGFDDPGNNGAVVGSDPSLGDFSPESTIVNGGSQSLPIHFDNSVAPRSEATRTFAASQDWSKHGVQGLVLSFHGSVDNTGGRLYVKVNDTQVVYDGDPADLQLIGWHKWTIDLGELPAATRDAVRSLTIGIDGGGSGVVYIDEIFLTP